MKITKNVEQLNEIFKSNNFDFFIVGGAVRDFHLGVDPHDFDAVTNAFPNDIIRMMHKHKIQTIEIGKAFGVIVAIFDDEQIEIATYREDIGEGRRPDSVKFSTIEKDVLRRDFTINAMFYDIDKKETTDLVGGLDDLKNGIIRTVGDPQQRFTEDNLRKLRGIRFKNKLGFTYDSETEKALLLNNSLLKVSDERIRKEFISSITSAKNTITLLSDIQNFNHTQNIFRNLVINTDYIHCNNYIIQMAILLKDNHPYTVGKELNRMSYTDKEIKNVNFLLHLKKFTTDKIKEIKNMQKLSSLTRDEIIDFAKIKNLDLQLINKILNFNLTVSGDDESLQHLKGKELGDKIKELEIELFLNEKMYF
jgi:tRNA nucleotidyltransferase/poly(A) polymerase